MRKDERVTLLLLNQTGGIEKCDYQNMNRKIAPLQEWICVDGIQRWWSRRSVPLLIHIRFLLNKVPYCYLYTILIILHPSCSRNVLPDYSDTQ